MVYSRLVDGYGPYLYRSVRKGQSVLSIYIGPGNKKKAASYTTPGPSTGALDKFKPQPQTTQHTHTLKPQESRPEKPKIKIEHKEKGQTILTHLERMHLYAFCQKNGIDRAEIDHKVSYEENKEYLETLAQHKGHTSRDIELSEQQAAHWAGRYQEFKEQLKEDKDLEKLYKDYIS